MVSKRIFITGFLFSLILLFGTADAQEFKRQFRDAKELFRKEQYVQAMDAFKPLIAYDKSNPYSEYASYYYGLSAMRLGFMKVAKDIFIQTRKLYPQWNQLDEVNFLLGKIYFDQREYFQAMLVLKEIRDWPVTLEGQTMKRFYLSQVSDPETLRMMLEEYPEETEVARALVRVISNQPQPGRDTRLMDSLIARFNFERSQFPVDSVLVSKKKDRYSISLLLPFLVNTLEPTPLKKRNQFALDLYEGMKMAADTLDRTGTHLDLFAYDTERSPEALKKVLELEELKSTDLLVGPLFQEQSKPVQDFSMKNRINVINPVSNNSEFLGKNPWAMLFQPSHETLGIRSAELVAAIAKRKNCIVYFGDSPRDSVKAFSFVKRAIALGLKVVRVEEVNKENSGNIYTELATPTEHDEFKNPVQFTLRRDSIGSIYVATDDPVIFTKVISGVETRGDSVMIVGNENWIAVENSSLDYSIFERLQIVLESPNYVSAHDPGYVEFKRKYRKKHGVIPSDYAWLGYEFINFTGQALKEYGVYFQLGLVQESEFSGRFVQRYDYRNSRDNQRVPFIHFRRGELVSFTSP